MQQNRQSPMRQKIITLLREHGTLTDHNIVERLWERKPEYITTIVEALVQCKYDGITTEERLVCDCVTLHHHRYKVTLVAGSATGEEAHDGYPHPPG